jgi:hypothetical protein
LDLVVEHGVNEYDLFIRVDANTKRHLTWFYFSIERITPNKKYKFNILNFTKKNSLYNKKSLKIYARFFKDNKVTEWR